MEKLNNLFSPTFIFFVIIILGFFVSKIKILSISFDISSILIVSILVGVTLSTYFPYMLNEQFNIALSQYSKLGTSLFTSVIGLSSCQNINKNNIKSNLIHFALGALIVLSGMVSAKIIGFIDMDFNHYLLLGILCGALTSTPGLISICEMNNINPQLATIGYGSAYFFGVIGVVLFVQLFSMKSAVKEVSKKTSKSSSLDNMECLFAISVVCAIGYFLGSLKLPFVNYSIGTTGGILAIGMIVGAILDKFPNVKKRIAYPLQIYRNFGLVLFFIGNGVSAGQSLKTTFNLKWFIYGAIITTFALLIGTIMTHIVHKKNIITNLFIISGGMTSSPGMSLILKKNDDKTNISTYSFAYLGALITMIIGIRFI